MAADALLETKNNVLMFKALGTIVLRQFHVQGIVFGLRALAESQSEVDLPRCPSTGCCHQEAGSNSGPSNKRTVGDAFVVLEIATAAPARLELG